MAERVHRLTSRLADGLRSLGLKVAHENFFDTIRSTWIRAKYFGTRHDSELQSAFARPSPPSVFRSMRRRLSATLNG